MKAAWEKIRFHYLVPPFWFPDRTGVKAFIRKKLDETGRQVDAINFIFCNDMYLLEMNRSYLKHDTLTDIITFELSTQEQPLLSDIYISYERVKENASDWKRPVLEELHRVIFHGALHLLGFKDKSNREADNMRKAEDLWLEEYFVSRNTVSFRNNRV